MSDRPFDSSKPHGVLCSLHDTFCSASLVRLKDFNRLNSLLSSSSTISIAFLGLPPHRNTFFRNQYFGHNFMGSTQEQGIVPIFNERVCMLNMFSLMWKDFPRLYILPINSRVCTCPTVSFGIRSTPWPVWHFSWQEQYCQRQIQCRVFELNTMPYPRGCSAFGID